MLQFITNTSSKFSLLEEVKLVLDGGCKWIQLRLKDISYDKAREIARELKPICSAHEAILIIDDMVEIAKELELDGVHLGKNDMPPMEARKILGEEYIIGVTANTFDDIKHYSTMDIDYIGLGPFRFTSTKDNLSPILGIEGYESIMMNCMKEGIKIPTVAIGGIEYDDIQSLMNTGINGVAVSGSIINSSDPTNETKKMITILERIIEERSKKLEAK